MAEDLMKKATSPRPRDARQTQMRILDAAQAAFTAHGYSDVGIRDLAKAAEANQNLITRYFGGKRGLFEQALAATLHLDEMFIADRKGFGANMARLLRENKTKTARAGSMMALSIGDPQSREVSGKLIEERIIQPISEWLGGPNASARARLVSILSLGYTVLHLLTDGGEEKLPPEEQEFFHGWMERAMQGLEEAGTANAGTEDQAGQVRRK